jgi:alpha-ribazole phosphatase
LRANATQLSRCITAQCAVNQQRQNAEEAEYRHAPENRVTETKPDPEANSEDDFENRGSCFASCRFKQNLRLDDRIHLGLGVSKQRCHKGAMTRGVQKAPPFCTVVATQAWFIRHGEVEAPYVGAFVGVTDVGLSPVGAQQAEGIAQWLEEAEVDAIIASPRKRAQLTAGPLATSKKLPIITRNDLAEMDFGDWETMFWEDIEAKDPEFAARWQSDPGTIPCPNGETANTFALRVQNELDRILREFDGKTVAIFCHAGVNRAILSHVTKRPYMESFHFAQDYGCVNAGAWDLEHGVGQIALLNYVPGPRSNAQGDGQRVEE